MSPRQAGSGAPGPRPPRWLAGIARRLVDRRDREDLLPEMEALYRRRAGDRSRGAADRAYLREVLALARRRVAGVVGGAFRDLVRGAGMTLRGLRRSPGFSALAVGTLALGLGATTAMVGVADAVLLKDLPYAEPDRLVSVWDGWGVSRGELDIVQRESRTLDAVGAWVDGVGRNLATADGAVRLEGAAVSPELLELLGVGAAVGRRFRGDEGRPGGGAVVLLSHGLWTGRFGADRGVVGRTVSLDGRPHEVVGVLPPRFAFPTPGLDFLLPAVLDPSDPGTFWGWGGHRLVGRLAPGASPEDVRREMLTLHETMRLANPLWTPEPDARDAGVVVPLREAVIGDAGPVVLTLAGAVAVVLLVVCANVANLLLSRGLARRRDLALRIALGAGARRVLREQFAESLTLTLLGAVLGGALAAAALGVAGPALEGVLPRAAELGVDGRVLAASAGLAVVVGILAGGLPAWRASRAAPAGALREGGAGAGKGVERRRLSRTLVAAQVAAAVVLVTGAGLLLRTLGAFQDVDPGFRPEGVLTARVTLGDRAARGAEERIVFFAALRERLAASGAVESVGIASSVPFGGLDENMATVVDGVTDNPNDLPVVDLFRVSPGYMETLGIPVVEGRPVEPTDGPDGVPVAWVDAAAARRFWPGESPVGRVVRYPWRGAGPIRVAGVVGSVRDDHPGSEPRPSMYVPFDQWTAEYATVVIRHRGDVPAAVAALRSAVSEVDEGVAVSAVRPYRDLVDRSLSRTRLTTLLLGVFAGAALLLGCLGVYGVAAYAVRERTREFGVRMALGARGAEIRRSVLADAALLAVPGAVVGLALAVPAGRLLEGFLYGVRPLDPVTFVAVAALMLASAMVAVYLPARRATRVDPTVALRGE